MDSQLVEDPVDRIDRDGEATVVYLTGELDLLVSQGLQRLLDTECEQNPRRLCLDLTGVDFLDFWRTPTGLRPHAQAARRRERSPRARQLHAGDPPTALA